MRSSSWKIVARPLPRLVTWYRASGKSMRGGRGIETQLTAPSARSQADQVECVSLTLMFL